MIIIITTIAGLLIFTGMIVLHEYSEAIRHIQKDLAKLFVDGGVYPKAKPIDVGKLNRTLSVKAAPLYHVITR